MGGIGFFSRSNANLETSGQVTLKKGVTKQDFHKQVNKVLDDNIITKSEYKSLKDSITGGREELNSILSQVGIASTEQLETIFGREKNHGEISITPKQKDQLKSILTKSGYVQPQQQNVQLNEGETKAVENINKILKPVDRNDISQRYSLNDFVFSPEVSGMFKEHLKSEYGQENMDFVVELKNNLKSPTKENLTELYNKYVKTSAENEINLPDDQRKICTTIFKNPNSSLEDMLKSLEKPAKECMNLMRQSLTRYSQKDGISKSILSEAMNLPTMNKRINYIESVIDANKNDNANTIGLKKLNVEAAQKALFMRVENK